MNIIVRNHGITTMVYSDTIPRGPIEEKPLLERAAMLDALKMEAATDRLMAMKICRIVTELFGVSIERMKSRERTARVAHARMVAMFLIRRCAGWSVLAIAHFFHRDHSTVTHAENSIRRQIADDGELAAQAKWIESIVGKIPRKWKANTAMGREALATGLVENEGAGN